MDDLGPLNGRRKSRFRNTNTTNSNTQSTPLTNLNNVVDRYIYIYVYVVLEVYEMTNNTENMNRVYDVRIREDVDALLTAIENLNRKALMRLFDRVYHHITVEQDATLQARYREIYDAVDVRIDRLSE